MSVPAKKTPSELADSKKGVMWAYFFDFDLGRSASAKSFPAPHLKPVAKMSLSMFDSSAE